MKTSALILVLLSLSSTSFAHDGKDRAAFVAALQACAADNGVTLPAADSGERPSREDMEKLHPCMVAKGFKGPPHRHHDDSTSTATAPAADSN